MLIVALMVCVPVCKAQEAGTVAADTTSAETKKVLVIGDSMTGWMAERLNEYGKTNGFEVATAVWDGSTISKWAHSRNLKKLIEDEKPDAILVNLGMNEMYERNPEKRLKGSTESLISMFKGIPYLWIGPPSWPGHPQANEFNDWMEQELGEGNYFKSYDLKIPRQSAKNPHPSRKGIELWIDSVADWIPAHSSLGISTDHRPGPGKVSRGKTFIYKRMKETF